MAFPLLARPFAVALLTLIVLLLSALSALAAVGSIVAVSGQVGILRGGKPPAETAQVGTLLNVGDFVRTKSNSSAQVKFDDGNVIRIAPRSRIDISEYAVDRDTRTIGLARGKVEAVVVPPPARDTKLRPKRFEIHTPNAVAGVRGTDLVVFYEGNTTGILVLDLHGGDNVYAFSLMHPDQVFDLPVGFIIHIRDDRLPDPHKASEAEIKSIIRELLAQAGGDVGELQNLLAGGESDAGVPITIPPDFVPELIQPAYEVGRVDMTGSVSSVNTYYDLTVDMTASFLSPTSGGEPTSWVSNNVVGTWTNSGTIPFDPTGVPVFLNGNGPNGSASAEFMVNSWDTASGHWNAAVNFGNGVTGAGTSMQFDGTATGTGAVSTTSPGSFNGTAGGAVMPGNF